MAETNRMETTQPQPIGAGGRLTGIPERLRDIRAESIAAVIRQHGGSVREAMAAYGISYAHACRIRAGWRPSGIHREAISYQSRGWTDGRRNGWSHRLFGKRG